MAKGNPFTFQTQYSDRETDKLYCKNRYCDPTRGRWLSQDPKDELGWSEVSGLDNSEVKAASEPYLYAFLGNDGINNLDPFGLWKINRNGGAKASAEAEQGDTVDELAELIGLSANEYEQWLTPLPGAGLPGHSSYHMCGGSFEIPNTVVAYWAGYGNDTGRDYIQWGPNVSYLRALGFSVDERFHVPGSNLPLRGIFVTASTAKELHGLYFWGEGLYFKQANLYVGLGSTPKPQDDVLYWQNTGLAYRIALGLVFACGSNSGESALMSTSSGRIWNGFPGVLVPHPFHQYDVSHFIHPGDQATQSNPKISQPPRLHNPKDPF